MLSADKDNRSALEQIFGSIFEPGAPPVVFQIINWSLVALMILIVLLLTLGGWSKSDLAIHMYIFLGLSVGLLISTNVFVSLLPPKQEKETIKPKNNNPKKQEEKETIKPKNNPKKQEDKETIKPKNNNPKKQGKTKKIKKQ